MPDAGYISTVKDFIESLQQYDPEAPVYFNTEDDEDMVLLSVYEVDDTVQIDVGPLDDWDAWDDGTYVNPDGEHKPS